MISHITNLNTRTGMKVASCLCWSASPYCRAVWLSTRAQLNSNLFEADSPPVVMPTYEYSCEKCGQTFEAFQSIRAEPFRECPKELCRLPKWGHGKVKRLPGTGAGIIFKGSGFYATDYRSDSYKKAAEKESTPKAAETSGDKASGSKPATKSPPSRPNKTAEKTD